MQPSGGPVRLQSQELLYQKSNGFKQTPKRAYGMGEDVGIGFRSNGNNIDLSFGSRRHVEVCYFESFITPVLH